MAGENEGDGTPQNPRTADGQPGTQPEGNEGGLSEAMRDAIAGAVKSTITEVLPGFINASVASQIKRAMPKDETPKPEKAPEAAKDPEVRLLQQQVQQLTQTLADRDKRTAELEQMAEVRRIAADKGAVDADRIARLLRPDLMVTDDGRMYRDAKDENGVPVTMTAEQYIEREIRANAWMRAASGKNGLPAAPDGTDGRDQGPEVSKEDLVKDPEAVLYRALGGT